MKRLWILGASDPEIEMIETLLRESGERVAYAMVDGKRVHPGNAYASTGWTGHPMDDPAVTQYVTVECGTAELHSILNATAWSTHIDHHRLGDPGYGKPPAEFLPASSIGQVISLLGKEGLIPASFPRLGRAMAKPGEIADIEGFAVVVSVPDSDPEWAEIPLPYLLCAAADHCLAAAYQDKCPRVDPDALMRWRVSSRAKFQKRSEESILADIEAARKALHLAPFLEIDNGIACSRHYPATPGNNAAWDESECDSDDPCLLPTTIDVRDMRNVYIPELPEAAAREGISFLSLLDPAQAKQSTDPTVSRNTRKKYFMSGNAGQVQWFLDNFPAVEKYGDPARGFAGGYAE